MSKKISLIANSEIAIPLNDFLQTIKCSNLIVSKLNDNVIQILQDIRVLSEEIFNLNNLLQWKPLIWDAWRPGILVYYIRCLLYQ